MYRYQFCVKSKGNSWNISGKCKPSFGLASQAFSSPKNQTSQFYIARSSTAQKWLGMKTHLLLSFDDFGQLIFLAVKPKGTWLQIWFYARIWNVHLSFFTRWLGTIVPWMLKEQKVYQSNFKFHKFKLQLTFSWVSDCCIWHFCSSLI